MQRVTVVIFDLDNTLFDWVDIWHQSFLAMLDALVQQSGIERDVLLGDFKDVFTRHGTSEYAFAIEELACLQAKHPGEDVVKLYDSAVHAFRSARKRALRLFPGVEETLQTLKDEGCLLIGYTESMAYYTHYRMRKLGLDRILDYIYSPEDHELPENVTAEKIRMYPADSYRLRRTIRRHTPKNELKPNPDILLQIVRDVAASPTEVLYVGDSLMKDISMAKEAKVTDAWAKYGTAQDRIEYELLRRVTHWTESSVEKEKLLSEDEVKPTLTLGDSLADVLPAFSFGPYVDQSSDRLKTVVDAWNTTVNVQMHFNELEMKIRNFALTIMGAVLAGASFSIKEQTEFAVRSFHVPVAALVLLAGTVVWIAFYLMDRHWYHNLLLGSVEHGIFIEKRYQGCLPELGLAKAIASASPTVVCGWRIRSSAKLRLFYLFGIILLIFAAVGSFFVVGKNPEHKREAPSAATDSAGDASVALPADNKEGVEPVSSASSNSEPVADSSITDGSSDADAKASTPTPSADDNARPRELDKSKQVDE